MIDAPLRAVGLPDDDLHTAPPEEHGARPGLLRQAHAERRARLQRRQIFHRGGDLFHEPAWDILLDLFIAEAEGERPDLATLCAHAGIECPTALRWITSLEQLGLVEAGLDQAGDSQILRLTPRAHGAMDAYFSAV